MTGKPRNLSDAERAARSARMKALNATPAFQQQRRHGKRKWSETSRALAAGRMRALHADPAFKAAQDAARPNRCRAGLVVPDNAMAIVRGLFVEMNGQLATIGDVAKRSGVSYDTIRGWRIRAPHADLLEAALNTLDLELAIVPIGTRDEHGFIKKKTSRGVAK